MWPRVLLSAVLVVASFACTNGEPGPDAVPQPRPSGEPGVVNLISDGAARDDAAVPGSGIEYGKYAPGSR